METYPLSTNTNSFILEEVNRLRQIFSIIIDKVPEMATLLDSLQQYCMSETTFDETDFRRLIDGVLQETPNMTRLRLNLPFQVIGRASRTATLLLASMFACFANRPSEHKPLETLVLHHVSDSTILDICKNPFDVGNALKTFRSLKNLVISIKRQETSPQLMTNFTSRLWLLITEAKHLESLCITGWNAKSVTRVRRRRARGERTRVDFNDWMMKSLPYPKLDDSRTLKHLRFLELKRIDIDPTALEKLIEQNSASLKELYLTDVYLKVFEQPDGTMTALWIGPGNGTTMPKDCCWLAEKLRGMEHLKLEVLRATALGYNDFDAERTSTNEFYDFEDPLGLNRSLEQRFVEAVLSSPLPHWGTDADGLVVCPTQLESKEDSEAVQKAARKIDYDAEAFQCLHNTTSHWKYFIDGLFNNYNETALIALQKIVSVADTGMTLLSDEIDRIHSMPWIPADDDRGEEHDENGDTNEHGE